MLAKYNFIIKIVKAILISLSVLFFFLILFQNKGDNVSFVEEVKGKSRKISDSEVNVGNPVFSSNGETSYRFFAQNINKGSGEMYYLDKISGTYHLENKQNITINAINCALNNENDSAILNNDVKIGYENYLLVTDKINIDLNKKSAKNDDFVMVIGEDGKITADRFKTNEDFCEVTFDGNVKARFTFGDTN